MSSTFTLSMWNTTANRTSSATALLSIKSPMIILVWFEIIAACIIYGLGFIGNLFALIIFYSQEEFRNVSTGVLFSTMTISNTIHLWTLTTEFLSAFNVLVYSNIFLQCRMNYFIQNTSRAVSTYIAIGIVIDRFLRSEMLLRSRRICTPRNAIKWSLTCVIIFATLCSFWFCPLNSLNPVTHTCYTGQSVTYNYFISNIFFPGRFVVVCIIPVIVMSTANIRMVYNIRQSRQRVRPANHTNNTVTAPNASLALRRMTPLDRMLFLMALVNVTAFIITQIPFHTYSIVRIYYYALDISTHSLVRAMLLIWSSIYFGVGSYLYCLASPLFREKVLKVMKNIINCRLHYPAG